MAAEGRRQKVIWTEQEEDKLFEALAKAYKADPSLKKSTKRAAEMGQLVLPEHRHRVIQSPLHWPTRLRSRLVAAGFIGSDAVAPAEVDKNVIRINQLADERDTAVKLAEEVQAVANAQREEIKQLRKQLAEVPSEAQVLKTFVADIIWEVESRRRAVPGATSQEVNKTVAQVAPVPRYSTDPADLSEGRPKLPRVLIVGGKDDKFQKIQSEFNGKIRLEHWRDGDMKSLEAKAANADMVYCIMGDVSHDQVAHVTKKTDKFQRVSAYGNQPLIDLINGWLERRAREGAKA